MEKYEFKEGEWYSLIFWDHVHGGDEAVTIRVCGYFIKEDNISFIFSTWDCQDEEMRPENRELVAILKSTLASVVHLPPHLLLGQ